MHEVSGAFCKTVTLRINAKNAAHKKNILWAKTGRTEHGPIAGKKKKALRGGGLTQWASAQVGGVVGRPPLQPRPSTASSRARSAPPLPAYLFTEPGLSPW